MRPQLIESYQVHNSFENSSIIYAGLFAKKLIWVSKGFIKVSCALLASSEFMGKTFQAAQLTKGPFKYYVIKNGNF